MSLNRSFIRRISQNPFRSQAEFKYGLDKKGDVSIEIFDISGKKIRTLINKICQPGIHTVVWQGDDEFGEEVANGLYCIRMNAGNDENNMQMIKTG